MQHQCQTERCIQTDLTYPLESNDLRQGCFLIDDDSNHSFQCDSPHVMLDVKKEEVIHIHLIFNRYSLLLEHFGQ